MRVIVPWNSMMNSHELSMINILTITTAAITLGGKEKNGMTVKDNLIK